MNGSMKSTMDSVNSDQLTARERIQDIFMEAEGVEEAPESSGVRVTSGRLTSNDNWCRTCGS
jgi:hypothetical protein